MFGIRKTKSKQEFFQNTTNENLYNGKNVERNGTVGEHRKYHMEIYIYIRHSEDNIARQKI